MSEQWSVKVRNLDFSECKYRGEIYKLLRTELELPRWCGSNLNALWDAVTGIMYTPVEIRIVRKAGHSSLLAEVEQIISLFQEAEETYHEVTVVVLNDNDSQ